MKLDQTACTGLRARPRPADHWLVAATGPARSAGRFFMPSDGHSKAGRVRYQGCASLFNFGAH